MVEALDRGLEEIEVAITGRLASRSHDGAPSHDEAKERLYTTAQLSKILDVPQQRIRSWVRSRLIEPVKTASRLAFFDFRQVAVAKALSRLTAEGVKPARIKKSLLQLATWLPEAEIALAQLETLENGGPLILRTSGGTLAETSGQLRLDFDLEQIRKGPDEPSPPGAELWFRRGVLLEEDERPEEAIHAYAKALEAGNPSAELAFNLGNALFASERRVEAAQCFALATEIDPDHVEAWNNLGNSLVETDRPEDGLAAFRRALAIEPDYADAHFNLAETLAARGEIAEAREHWHAYLEQDPHSVWATEVRQRLHRTR